MVFEKSSCLLLLVVELNNPAILFKPLQTTNKIRPSTFLVSGTWITQGPILIYNILSSITKTKQKDISYPKSTSCGGKK